MMRLKCFSDQLCGCWSVLHCGMTLIDSRSACPPAARAVEPSLRTEHLTTCSVDPTDPARLRHVGAGIDRPRPLVFHQSEVTTAAT